MRNELAGLVEVPFVVARDVTACVEGVHRAIAGRVFGVAGPVAAPARVLHDGIAGGVYRALDAVTHAAGRGAALAAGLLPAEATALSARPAGGRLVAMLNGVAGDRLAAAGSGAAIPMAIRAGDADVALDRAGLAAAFPRAGARVAVFVHGLCGTEHDWDARGGPDSVAFGPRLEADLGWTPVLVRYNTGRPVSDSGRELSALLEAAVDAWPVPVREIALVGHSMGGLVARAACHHGDTSGARWTSAIRHVVCLGAPHLGAPLEQAAHLLGRALDALPETRPFAELVRRRSAGIKDLRLGSPGARLLPGVAHHFAGATVTADPEHPVGRLVGDLLVPLPSASGGTSEHGRHLGGLHHFDLLHRPAVYEQLRRWLS